MSKARDLADLISAGNPLADGVISVSEVTGAAPLASPTFTGTVTIGGAAYPTSDGTSGQFIQTNGAGVLSFQSIPTINTLNDVGNVTITSAASGEVLSWNGSAWVNSVLEAFDTQTATTTSTTQTAVASYVASTSLGIEITVIATDTVATERTITKLLVTHDGTTAVATQYGEVNTATAIASFDVDISGGNVRLLATAASANSTNFTANAVILA